MKAPIEDYVDFLIECAAEKTKFVPGAQGEKAKLLTLNSPLIKSLVNGKKETLEVAAYYDRFWDKPGIVYGYYNLIFSEQIVGEIDNIFYDWCEGTIGLIDNNRKMLHKGALVFCKNDKNIFTDIGVIVSDSEYQSTVPKVAYITKESGLIIKKLTDEWNWFGYPTKYFQYPKYAGLFYCCLGERELKEKDFGEDVRSLQRLLLSLGYALSPQGAYGFFDIQTKKAVEKFNNIHCINSSTFNKDTYFALIKEINSNI